MSRLNREQRRVNNASLAEGSRALKSGKLEAQDPQLAKLLSGLEDLAEVQAIGGDFFEVAPAKRKSDRKADRVFLVPVERPHGLGQDPLTHKALAATQRFYSNGGEAMDTNAPSKGAAIERVKELLQKHVMPTSYNTVGRLGSREAPTAEEALGRAASLFVDTYNGGNRRMQYAFGNIPLDAGHIQSHASRPDLSNDPLNIEMQIGYVNKGQAATEKMAASLGREATPEELANGIFRSHLNKILSDVVLPGRKGSKEREAFMAPINAKLGGF